MVVSREIKIYVWQITEWFKEFQCHKLVGSEILKQSKAAVVPTDGGNQTV